MSRIFISYRRDDSAGYVNHLGSILREHFGHEAIFRDINTIKSGEDFVEVIEEAVGSCEVLLAIIGKQWLTLTDAKGKRRLDSPDDFVRLEIASALKRNIHVIPVLVGGATMPSERNLPKDLQALARRNAQEIADRIFQEDVDKLIQVIANVIGETDLQTPPNSTTTKASLWTDEMARLALGNEKQLADLRALTAFGVEMSPSQLMRYQELTKNQEQLLQFAPPEFLARIYSGR